MTTYGDLLRRGIGELQAAGIEGAARDVRVLLANRLKIDRARLTLILPEQADCAARHEFMVDIRSRAGGMPVSAIVGHRDFYGRRFIVDQNVLDPRPETECLVALALEQPFEQVLDLGTGSGCILLTLLAERPGTTGVGTDISPAALTVAGRNAAALGVADRLCLTQSHWFSGIGGQFDLIVSNPPYIAAHEMAALAPEVRDHDPHIALTDGGDGLDAYRAIAARAGAHLTPGGRLLVEIGPTQGADVATLCRSAGLDDVTLHPDLDGRDRVVAARNR